MFAAAAASKAIGLTHCGGHAPSTVAQGLMAQQPMKRMGDVVQM